MKFSEAFGEPRLIRLQQDDSSLIVRVADVDVAGDGAIALGDPADANVKIYGRDGRLRSIAGRGGSGPGEFSSVSELRFTPSGSILAWDRRRRVFVEYARDGDLVGETQVPGLSLDDFAILADGRIAAAGRFHEAPEQTLHLFSPQGVHEASYLRGAVTGPAEQPEHSYWPPLEKISVALLDSGRAVVVSQVSDSVWSVDLDGGAVLALPLTYSGRRVPTLPERQFATMQQMIDGWITRLQLVNSVHAMSGSTVVSLMTGRRDSSEIDLLLIEPSGARAVLKGAPYIVAAQGDVLVALHDPEEAEVTLALYERVQGSGR